MTELRLLSFQREEVLEAGLGDSGGKGINIEDQSGDGDIPHWGRQRSRLEP